MACHKKRHYLAFFICCFALLSIVALSGCGGGGGGGGGGVSQTPVNTAPVVSSVTATGNTTDITLTFDLSDAEGHVCELFIDYWNGTTWQSATMTESCTNVSVGAGKTFTWQSATDEGGKNFAACKLRVRPADGTNIGNAVETLAFALNNNILPTATITSVVGTAGDIDVVYDLVDTVGQLCTLSVEYWNGTTWLPATIFGALTDRVPETGKMFVWQSTADIAGVTRTDFKLRITANDGVGSGTPGESADFPVYNDSPPVLTLDSVTGASNDIVLAYSLSDGDSHSCTIAVQYWDGSDWQAATCSGDLSAVTPGAGKSITWHSSTDELYQNITDCVIRLTPTGNVPGAAVDSSAFLLANNLFSEVAGTPFLGLSDSHCEMADIDGDGDLDIILGGSDQLNAYFNDGTGAYTIGPALPAYKYKPRFSLGDYDGDGDVDIILSSLSGMDMFDFCDTRILVNNGSGTFTNTGPAIDEVFGFGVFGDVNGDGYQDLVIGGQNFGISNDYTSAIYLNDKAGGFTKQSNPFGLLGNPRFGLGDLDGDGDLDVVFTAFISGTGHGTRVYLNDGDGNFTDSGQTLVGVDGGTLDLGDIDGDGDLDLALAGSTMSGSHSQLYLNDGTGTMVASSFNLPPFHDGDLNFGDADGDGDLDLMISGFNGDLSRRICMLYFNDGAGNLTDSNVRLDSFSSGALAWGDVDRDGKLDIFACGYSTEESAAASKLYKNMASAVNTLPQQPANLVVSSVTGSGPYDVTFSWDDGVDTETTASVLNYQLRVGTASGTNNIYPGHHRSDGNTLLQQRALIPSNLPAKPRWTLSLSAGTYYWTVQSIDTSFQGSTVVDEKTLTVP